MWCQWLYAPLCYGAGCVYGYGAACVLCDTLWCGVDVHGGVFHLGMRRIV